MNLAGILVLAALYLALCNAGGAFSTVLQLLFLWTAVAAECISDRHRHAASISLILAVAIASTGLLRLTSLPALFCLLPAALTIVALSDCARALRVLPGCLFGSSMFMALTVKLGPSAQVIAAADAGTVLSLCLFFGSLLCCYRDAMTRSHWCALAVVFVASVLLSGSTPSLLVVSASALVAGWAYLSGITFGEPRKWLICVLGLSSVAWWSPFASWGMKPSPLVTATLLPAQAALENTPFAQTANALRARFPSMQIWRDTESWTEGTTLFIPWTGQSDWTPQFWGEIAARADETHSHLVVFGEHTNLEGIRSRLAPLVHRYDLRFGDDTTTPRPNRDLLGQVWSLGVSTWPASLALNRGASVLTFGMIARPAVVGRDWFADAPGWRDTSARLGDGRATLADRLSDVVLVAHGLSPTRQSLLTLVADNSAFVEFNAVVQPPVAFERLATGLGTIARWDLCLCLLALGGVLAHTKARRLSVVPCATALALLVFPRASALATGPEIFLESPSPVHGYGPKSTSEFRLWWLARSGASNFDQVVLNDWRQLGDTCDEDRSNRRIIYFGVPGIEPACGLVAHDVFRFGKLPIDSSAMKILAADGSWANLSRLDGNPVTVIVGNDARAFVATWRYRTNEVFGWFDAGVIGERPSTESAAAFARILGVNSRGSPELPGDTYP